MMRLIEHACMTLDTGEDQSEYLDITNNVVLMKYKYDSVTSGVIHLSLSITPCSLICMYMT